MHIFMKLINFIVHPEFAILSTDKVSIGKYADRIVDIAQNENTYVVMSEAFPKPEGDFSEEIFWKLYGKELVNPKRRLKSNGVFNNSRFDPHGHINCADWESLIQIMNENPNEIRIHGCFFGEACLQNLAIQLYGYLHHNKHWYNWDGMHTVSQGVWENLRESFLEINGSLTKSNIRYGIVYSNDCVRKKETKSLFPKFLTRRTLDERLVDERTEIYGKG